MDVDRARSQGLCFKCGKHGHIAHNCPDNRRNPVQARAFVQELNDDEAEVFTRELHARQNPETPPQDFQNVQE